MWSWSRTSTWWMWRWWHYASSSFVCVNGRCWWWSHDVTDIDIDGIAVATLDSYKNEVYPKCLYFNKWLKKKKMECMLYKYKYANEHERYRRWTYINIGEFMRSLQKLAGCRKNKEKSIKNLGWHVNCQSKWSLGHSKVGKWSWKMKHKIENWT